MPEDITAFVNAGQYSLNAGYYGTMTYTFTWRAADASGEPQAYCAAVEQLYSLNTNPATFAESPAISHLLRRGAESAQDERG